MTNEEVINVLNTIYENPTVNEQIKEACIVAMEAVDIKNSVERITTGLEISSGETYEKNEIEELKGTMTNAEAIKIIKSIVETLDDYAFYTAEDKVAFDLAINALEREGTCENLNPYDSDVFACGACGLTCSGRNKNYCPNCGRRVEK